MCPFTSLGRSIAFYIWKHVLNTIVRGLISSRISRQKKTEKPNTSPNFRFVILINFYQKFYSKDSFLHFFPFFFFSLLKYCRAFPKCNIHFKLKKKSHFWKYNLKIKMLSTEFFDLRKNKHFRLSVLENLTL